MMHQKHFNKSTPLLKIKYHPLAMFPQGQDLPLFTLSPDQAADPWQQDPDPDLAKSDYEQLSLLEGVNDD